MKKNYLLGFWTGVSLIGMISVNAAQHRNTIQSCTDLLPAGHQFQLNINGTIDTATEQREFKGNMDLSDGTGHPNPKIAKTARPFIECVAAVIK